MLHFAATPNGQHQRCEPAAKDAGIATRVRSLIAGFGADGVRLTWA